MNKAVDIEVVPNTPTIYTFKVDGHPTPLRINIKYLDINE